MPDSDIIRLSLGGTRDKHGYRNPEYFDGACVGISKIGLLCNRVLSLIFAQAKGPSPGQSVWGFSLAATADHATDNDGHASKVCIPWDRG